MLPNREGRFRATILDRGISLTGQNKLTTAVLHFKITEELLNGEWQLCPDDFDIVGYFYVEKKGGSVNTVAVDQLKAALGWDGSDVFWIEDADLTDVIVQLKLGWETYDNKTRIKVQWLDAADSEGRGVQHSDDATRRAIKARLGAKLRANSGGVPAPAPKPKAPPPKTPAGPVVTSSMDAAWAVFTGMYPGKTQDELNTEWFALLGDRNPDKMTAADWGAFVAEMKATPF